MTKQPRRNHSPAVKAKLALPATKGQGVGRALLNFTHAQAGGSDRIFVPLASASKASSSMRRST
jgi:hypothetical protein